MFYELLVLGLACLGAPICARWAGFETKRKPFDLVGAGGIFFLLGASFNIAMGMFIGIAALCNVLMGISFVLGWIALLIGTFWVIGEVFHEEDHGVLHRPQVTV